MKISQLIRFALGLALVMMASAANAQAKTKEGQSIIGLKLRAGGRFDDVRMCVGSPKSVKGGPAMDVSFFIETHLKKNMSISIDIPVVRPILFGAAFEMLQFEPEVALLFRQQTNGNVDVIWGPLVGMTLHYGPDYNSERSGANRGPSFFALGPRVGAYVGLDFKRPGERFNFQLGLSPYVSPLFAVDDPEDHRGIVAGGMLDGLFRFGI